MVEEWQEMLVLLEAQIRTLENFLGRYDYMSYIFTFFVVSYFVALRIFGKNFKLGIKLWIFVPDVKSFKKHTKSQVGEELDRLLNLIDQFGNMVKYILIQQENYKLTESNSFQLFSYWWFWKRTCFLLIDS